MLPLLEQNRRIEEEKIRVVQGFGAKLVGAKDGKISFTLEGMRCNYKFSGGAWRPENNEGSPKADDFMAKLLSIGFLRADGTVFQEKGI